MINVESIKELLTPIEDSGVYFLCTGPDSLKYSKDVIWGDKYVIICE